MVPDTPHVEAALFSEGGVAEGLSKGKIVVDMSSISPLATKEFAKKINELGCDYLDAPVSGGEVGAKAASLTIMVGGPERAFNKVKPLFEQDGQEHHAGRRQRRRPDHQGRQPDHRRADHRGGRRGAAVRLQGRRRSGAGAAGADGRLRLVADSRSAWRAHGQAQFRAGLPHRAAPEGSQPRAGRRAGARHFAAEHGDRAAIVQRLRRPRRQAWDHSGMVRRWNCWPITKSPSAELPTRLGSAGLFYFAWGCFQYLFRRPVAGRRSWNCSQGNSNIAVDGTGTSAASGG